ncbi:MAG: hypothetical protein OEZ06_19025 [Myxococcales bacterium]|nr:hypothetical protein [Myxococcales bacterium]
MSGVRAAQNLARQPLQGDVERMQDALYDILATGIDPDGDISSEVVERFLFEHARTPKSAEQFSAFFAEHGIDAPDADAAKVTDLELPPLRAVPNADALEPIAASPSAATGALPPVPAPLPRTRDDLEDPLPTPNFEAVRARRSGLLPWLGMGLLGAAAMAALGFGYVLVRDLQGQVAEARQAGERDHALIEQLEARSAGIQASVAANGEMMMRMDQKNDLLLDSIASEPDPKEAAWKKRRGGR